MFNTGLSFAGIDWELERINGESSESDPLSNPPRRLSQRPRAYYDLDPSSVAYTRLLGLFRSRRSRQRSVVNASRKDGRAAAGVRGRTMAY